MTTERVVCADGVRVALHRHPASPPRRGVVLLAHAMMANARTLDRPEGEGLASFLATRGLEAYRLDFRGHGASRGAPPHAFDDLVRFDVPAAVAHVAGASGVAPSAIAYLGHSLGGLAGTATFATGAAPPPRRLVLVATNVWFPRPWHLGRRARMAAFDLGARLLGRAPARLLRVGSEDEPRPFVTQLVGWTRRHRFTARDGTDYQAALGRLAVPTLVVAAERDRLCPPADAATFATWLGGPTTFRRAGKAAGDAIDSDHFGMVADRRFAPTLWAEIAAFLAGS